MKVTKVLHRIAIVAGFISLALATIFFFCALMSFFAGQRTDSVDILIDCLVDLRISVTMAVLIAIAALSTSETLSLGEDFIDWMDRNIWKKAV